MSAPVLVQPWVWLVLLISPLAGTERTEDPNQPGRYTDSLPLRVLSGTDATFSYEYTLGDLLSFTFDEVTDSGLRFIGTCSPGTSYAPCNSTRDRVSFLQHDLQNPYVVLSNVTSDDNGIYQLQAVKKEDVASNNPGWVKVRFTLEVYEWSSFMVNATVPNIADGIIQFPPDHGIFESSVWWEFKPDHEHTVIVTIGESAPPANITIVKMTNAENMTLHCPTSVTSCSKGVGFPFSTDDTNRIRIEVDFGTQNVPDAVAVVEVKFPTPYTAAIIVPVVFLISLVIIGVGVYCSYKIKNKKLQKKKDALNRRERLWREVKEDSLNLVVSSVDPVDGAEYMFNLQAPIDDPEESESYDKSVVVLAKVICAFMNTSGGILQCDFAPTSSVNMRNAWKTACLEFSQKLLSEHCFDTCVRSVEKDASLVFYVKKYHRIVYDDNGCDDSTNPDSNIYNTVQTHLFPGEKLIIRSESNLSLNRHNVYYPKDYDQDEDIDESVRNDMSRLEGKVREFSENPKGGDIIFGIENGVEEAKGIRGVRLEGQMYDALRNVFSDICRQSTDDAEDIFYWYARKIILWKNLNTPSTKYVVQLHINGKTQRVFKREPKAFGVNESGNIEALTLENIEQRVTNMALKNIIETDSLTDTSIQIETDDEAINETDSLLIKGDTVKMTRNSSPVKDRKPVSIKTKQAATTSSTDRDEKWYRKDEIQDYAKQALQHTKVLSWRDHSTMSWDIDQQSREKRETDLMKYVLESAKPPRFTPNENTIVSFVDSDLQYNMRRCLEHIKNNATEKGYVLCLRGILDDILEAKCPDIVMLAVWESGKMELFCFSIDDTVSVKLYVNEIGRKLKKKLMSEMEQIGMIRDANEFNDRFSLFIDTKTIRMSDETFSSASSTDIETYFASVVTDTSNIHEALSNLLDITKTTVSHRLGESITYNLTDNQAKLISDLEIQFYFIEGPPGCGKSLVALSVYRKERDALGGKPLYCTPAEPFRNFLKEQGINRTMLLKDITDLLTIEDSNVIIIDDFQHLENFDEQNWFRFFEKMAGKRLYIFGDSKFHNYKHSDTLTKLEEIFVQFCKENEIPHKVDCLTEVFRNTQLIFSFLNANKPDNSSVDITCPTNIPGDDIKVYPVPNAYEDSDMNGVLRLIKSLIGKKVIGQVYRHSIVYNPEDIVILVDGNNDQKNVTKLMTLFGTYLPSSRPQRAYNYPAKGLVIATVEEYVGLDSAVCVYIENETSDKGATLDNSQYKVYIASRGINLVIFVPLKETTFKDADNMKFNKLDDIVIGKYTHFNTSPGDIYAILKVLQHTDDEEKILGGLSSITVKYSEDREVAKMVASAVVIHGGVQFAVDLIKKSANDEIRERALIILTTVAVYKPRDLMHSSIIDVILDTVDNPWQPEAWEGCYLLGHIIHSVINEAEPDRSNPKVFNRLTSTDIELKIQAAIIRWDRTKVSAVAHADVDYNTYIDWLIQDIKPVLQHLAAWSVCNLVLTSTQTQCPRVQRMLGIQFLEALSTLPSLGSATRELISEILDVCGKTRIARGGFGRDYVVSGEHQDFHVDV